MWLLNWMNSLIGSWGASINALSVLIRILTFPVSRYGMKQQKIVREKQAQLKPLINEINKKYKDNGEKCYKETMKLYREHDFSPFASLKGCLWLLIQIPIFLALFQILSHSHDIKGESFLWIQDLSLPERIYPFGVNLPLIGGYFNLLPIIMCIVQLIQARMMYIQGTDNSNSGTIAIYILPITMMILFYSFASGLLLYWTVTNILQVVEQWIIYKHQ